MRTVALGTLLVSVLTYGAVAAPAWAATDYRQVVDLTFPTERGGRYVDDYYVVGGRAAAHRAIDIYNRAGTPVYAAVGGIVTWRPEEGHPTAGYAIHVRGRDGRLYAYYHLGPHRGGAARAYAPEVTEGGTIARGQLIGYIGDSGNAVGGPAHLHFEIHDDGVTDPYGTNRLNPHASLRTAERLGDYPDAFRGGLLRARDRGAAVAAWQWQLNHTRSQPIAVDGLYGPVTENATREFQRARGILVDGIAGPQTLAAMRATVP